MLTGRAASRDYYKVFIAMTADKMLRNSLSEFKNIIHYLVPDMFYPGLKFIFLFNFSDLPAKGIISLYNRESGLPYGLYPRQGGGINSE